MRPLTSPAAGRTLQAVGVGYVLCWVVGLVLGGPDLLPDADAAQIRDATAASPTVTIFAVLVHGVAAVLLVALGARLPPSGRRAASLLLASAAAVLSLVQLTGELVLVSATESIDPVTVWTTITVADGTKMLVLAAWIAVVHGWRPRGTAAPALAPLFVALSGATVLALVVSGAGYLTRSPGLMTAAYVSLPLLLVWVLAATQIRSRPDVEISQAVPSSV
ncbi:hypothetical protein [Sanguibacter sp. 25GB23B1]|uniref:hypothetical protein n=1 Tax=unclassified Sanguibacter TaxID=2645534 RepID=UPI0032AFF9AE